MSLIGILSNIIENTFIGILTNIPWFFIFYICVKIIVRELKVIVKEVPSWIEKWERAKLNVNQVDKAIGKREKINNVFEDLKKDIIIKGKKLGNSKPFKNKLKDNGNNQDTICLVEELKDNGGKK
jgi:hypothetical protein